MTSARSDLRRRVLHIVLDLEAGGLERVVADLIRRTDPVRFDLNLLALQHLGRYAEGLEKWATLDVAKPMSRWSLLRPRSLAVAIGRITPNVVHTHSGVWFKAALASRMAGVPRLIHTDHGRQHPDPWSDRFQDGIAARWTDTVVAVSEPLRAQLEKTVVPAGTTLVTIPNGVDTDAFCPRPDTGTLRRELGVDASVPVIGSLGRLSHIKGYDVMIEAYAILLAEHRSDPPPILVIAGEGEEQDALRSLTAARGVSSGVRFLGWRKDVEDFHSALSLFTLSSRSEGTSISILEAMSAGLCPVVTNVGGNADVVGAGLAHRLVPPENPRALAQAWREALGDPVGRAADGRRARQRVVEEFSLGSAVARYESLYAGATPQGRRNLERGARPAP